MKFSNLIYLTIISFLNIFIRADSPYNLLQTSKLDRRRFFTDNVRREILFGTDLNNISTDEEEGEVEGEYEEVEEEYEEGEHEEEYEEGEYKEYEEEEREYEEVEEYEYEYEYEEGEYEEVEGEGEHEEVEGEYEEVEEGEYEEVEEYEEDIYQSNSSSENEISFGTELVCKDLEVLNEFYNYLTVMFKSIRNNYDYVKHTQNHINALKEIEDKLPDIEDIYNRDIYIKYLKICFKSIYRFTSFLSDEKFFKTPEISQTVINNINSKLTDINKFINGHKRALDVIDTNINETHFKTLSDDIISFKESIDQEVIYYKAYNDFRKEHYLDSVSDTRSKISEFFDIFRSTKRKITRMSEDDFQDEKNPFNDDYIKEITKFFKNIFVNIEKYEKLTKNYFKALNDVEHFQSILFPSLKENFKNFEHYY